MYTESTIQLIFSAAILNNVSIGFSSPGQAVLILTKFIPYLTIYINHFLNLWQVSSVHRVSAGTTARSSAAAPALTTNPS